MPRIASVFVVTRNGRRIEDINYALKSNAWERASELKRSFTKIGLNYGTISVEEVTRPNKIW
jgi:hypothetical protein